MYPYDPPKQEITEYQRPQTGLTDGVTGPVKVPFLQAAITGLLAAVFVATVAFVLRDWFWTGLNPWVVFVLTWTGGTFYSWLGYRQRWQHLIEAVLDVDLDGDGHKGVPPPPTWTPPVRIEVVSNNGNATEYIDLPYRDTLKQLAPGLLDGSRTFSLTACTMPGFGRKEFGEVRSVMINRGLAKWKNPNSVNQGVELTDLGRAVLTELLDQPGALQLFKPPAKQYQIKDYNNE